MAEEGEDIMADDAEGGVALPACRSLAAEPNGQVQHVSTVQRSDLITVENQTIPAGDPPLSKSAQKKLRKKAEWEAGRELRKVVRKEKHKVRKERKREAYQEQLVEGSNNTDGSVAGAGDRSEKSDERGDIKGTKMVKEENAARQTRKPTTAVQLPITFIFDCSFDDLMKDGELISLASQLTRCYSDNRKSSFRAHLALSSFNGKLKNRFETVLTRHHENWKGVRFLEEDFAVAAEEAKTWMAGPNGGKVMGALRTPAAAGVEGKGGSDEAAEAGEVVYLSSDSPDTLTELKPYSTYIIGGLVDRNRHKGICYKSAVNHQVRTARLPIGEFIEMASRAVLATNHVNEIMLKWLQLGDWGKAFFEVIPKRKGGKLREKQAYGPEATQSINEREDSEKEHDRDSKDTYEPSVTTVGLKEGNQPQIEDNKPSKRKLEEVKEGSDETGNKKVRPESIMT